MACPAPQMEAENRFFKALGGAVQYSFLLGRLAIAYKLDESLSLLIFDRGEAN